MKHLSHIQIDQLVSKMEDVSNNLFDWKEHIDGCDFCSNRSKEALSFNVNLEKFLKFDTSLKQKEFVKKIFHSDSRGKVCIRNYHE